MDGAVTSALVLGSTDSSAYFGDQKANEYSVDTATGKLRWKVHIDDHFAARITAAAQLHRGVLYAPAASFEEPLALSPTYECCTFRGSLAALDAPTSSRRRDPLPTVAAETGLTDRQGSAVAE